LRISLVGGGSDLLAYNSVEPGCVLSATIDKYIYVSAKRHFDRGRIRVAYSIVEDCASFFGLNHSMVREALTEEDIAEGVDITSIADLPSGIGLGSSSAFAVGLVQALSILQAPQGHKLTRMDIAKEAFDLEHRKCHRHMGYQDTYAAVVGGFTFYKFHKGEVSWMPLDLDPVRLMQLHDNLLLLWTGRIHDAMPLCRAQEDRLKAKDTREWANLRSMANLAESLYIRLRGGDDMSVVADALGASWALKRGFAGVSDSQIDKWYHAASEAAAPGPFGGKLLGAGGGGCLLFYAPQSKHKDVVEATGLRQIPFKFSVSGTQILHGV
jgi:D-glycero-alpha-D-manno-heptose-7-phosphate kinase